MATELKLKGNERLALLASRSETMMRAACDAGLPDVCRVELCLATYIGGKYTENAVTFQACDPADVAAWAMNFGGRVRLQRHATYTEVRAVIRTLDLVVHVWDHLPPTASESLIAQHGISPEDAESGCWIEAEWLAPRASVAA